MIDRFVKVEAQINEVKGMIRALANQHKSATATGPKPLDPTDVDLPSKDTTSVKAVDARLQDKQFAKALVDTLSTIGGITVKETVKRIMRQLLTNSCAENFNWIGKGGKLPFIQLKLREVVNEAVRANPRTSSATNKEVEDEVKYWL